MYKTNNRIVQLLGTITFCLTFFFCLQTVLHSAQFDQGESSLAQNDSAKATTLDEIVSPLIIVELESPPLAELFGDAVNGVGVTGASVTGASFTGASFNAKLDTTSATMQSALAALHAEQAAFMATLAAHLPEATVGQSINELGETEQQTYQTVFNGMAVNPGDMAQEEAMAIMAEMPGVKAVYKDEILVPTIYESVEQINAPAAWNSAAIGGVENAGSGIKIASIDTGVHHAAPMFDGTDYDYPPGYQPNGLGMTANNNGKIIVSRAYYRSWDPPLPGEEFAWPGPEGDSHGTHTASIAAGNRMPFSDSLLSPLAIPFSGVAPKAYVLSYKVIYGGEVINTFFFTTAELIMALEDVVRDGADVLNNSWTIFRTNADHVPIDRALVNVAKSGIFVVVSAGNEGPGLSSVHLSSPDYISVGAAGKNEDDAWEIPYWSSQGPAAGETIKPDLIAPGVDIFGQGYADLGGEEKHLDYGVASGTSMAAPHVAGAAALLKQIHPEWTNQEIKSALMSTAQHINAVFDQPTPQLADPTFIQAQPLRIGAGLLDVAAAVNPGIILDPPSVSFGALITGSQRAITVTLRSVAAITETYTVTTQSVVSGTVNFSPLPGFQAEPATLTMAPGETKLVTVTFMATAPASVGDNQGYLVLSGQNHKARLPMWARVNYSTPLADVLLVDYDGSESRNMPSLDVSEFYKAALNGLGYTYTHHPLIFNEEELVTLLTSSELLAYKAMILATGSNGNDTSDPFAIGGSDDQRLYADDMSSMAEYLANGGAIIAMSPNLAEMMFYLSPDDDITGATWYWSYFGANLVQRSITQNQTPTGPILSTDQVPPSLADMAIAVTEMHMDEVTDRHLNEWPNTGWEYTYTGTPILRYTGDNASNTDGYVAMSNRHQPSLDKPGDLTYPGRTVLTSFGLETMLTDGSSVGVTNPITPTRLLDRLLDFVWSEPPSVNISVTDPTAFGQAHQFAVSLSGGVNQMGEVDPNALEAVKVRWRFDDGTLDFDAGTTLTASRVYRLCGEYDVIVEVTDRNHNVAIGQEALVVDMNCTQPIKTWLPYLAYR